MAAALAKQFDAVWRTSDSPPDVFAFLHHQSGCSAGEKLSVLLTDQSHRWKTHQPYKVEDYLTRVPDFINDSRWQLELAVGEFKARQQHGKSRPTIDEFVSRFANISDTLRSKLTELASIDDDGGAESNTTKTFSRQPTIGELQLGRFRMLRVLGEGAFGRVFLAFDEQLQRQVAIKVPTPERFQEASDADTYLAEARIVAGLNHANIVPVYDTGRSEDGSVYIVSRFIDGCTLAEQIEQDRPNFETAAKLLGTVAEALQYSHDKRLIHRDIKPGNILLEASTGAPFVTDFGLAIKEEDYLAEFSIAGTPAYMSPEQARGEGHRLDGRSDVFSLGVVLYEVLTGARPFRGSTRNELFHQIISIEPSRPTEFDDAIPSELERICLKALSKRTTDRYASAAEFADDLFRWNVQPERESIEQQVVPKGLRSFDADDADFFLDLLPGRRNRDGLPESIQFWKSRIEETDPDETFSVGLVYGPSGCGKSSLVKAGLLPRLSSSVHVVYVEATPDKTEMRVLRGLRKTVPGVPDGLNLVETLARVRRGDGNKVVIVVDQFEQWLHAHRAEQDAELVAAVRQCDGGRTQAIVMVRDDFAMAAARFMDSVDVPILQGENFATVDLFDVAHAKTVLTKFGQGFGKLPKDRSKISETELEFLNAVTSGLAQDGKAVSVHLALFAEMVKGKPWTPTTLDEVGGTKGIGVNFLEETFGSRGANPKHRLHQQVAREILMALLPDVGSNIKGHMRSHDELLSSSGYQDRPDQFNDVLRILDGELRLITPTDPEGFQSDSGACDSKFYQLTHDYLVPSLRDWLTRKQKESRRGRAQLKMEEHAAVWTTTLEARHLPSLSHCLRIFTFTNSKMWNHTQKRMMRSAIRLRATQWGLACVLIGIIGWVFLGYDRSVREENLRKRIDISVSAMGTSRTILVHDAIKRLKSKEFPEDVVLAKLQLAFEEASQDERLSLAYALAQFGDIRSDFLAEQVLAVNWSESANVVGALSLDRTAAIASLRKIGFATNKGWRDQARIAVVAMQLGDHRMAEEMSSQERDPSQRTVLIDTLNNWTGDLSALHTSVKETEHPDLQYALCLGVGGIEPDRLTLFRKNTVADWVNLLRGWHRSQPSAGTHSASAWALRALGGRPPTIGRTRPSRSVDWCVNSKGMTMIRASCIQPRLKQAEIDKTPDQMYSFWISDSETTVGLFNAFLGDTSYAAVKKPVDWQMPDVGATPNHPVRNTSWVDAALFCNWLSSCEGLDACYPTSKIVQFNGEHRVPVLDASKNGYRIPSVSEWTCAASTGVATRFFCGDAEEYLGSYVSYTVNSNDAPTQVRSRMCNRLGQFDGLGNVAEWCEPDSEGTARYLGGAWQFRATRCELNDTIPTRVRPWTRNEFVGFRVVRNVEDEESP